ncbi:MAG: zinc-dependent metalloprotease, partial [Planctomycetales bacterium]|nr:zinc-dependent metalloprotease [Planctomycetales bacterium]
VLPGFAFSASKSTWAAVKGFEKNTEIQVAATYASSGNLDIDTVPDSRGATVNVHYSISKIPTTGYTPRLADDRVGYFLTVVKDYSKDSDRDQFVRYVNRWNLQKADAKAAVSPPKEPIIFWLEKTIPYEYRKPIREGILEWNKAFEAAGFANAIEVRQQPDDADWDPEDISYNTFRWITSSAGFAMGPSRVNPYTGQILDADIIFDADFLSFWKHEFETFTPESIAAMTGGPLDLESYEKQMRSRSPFALNDLMACRRSDGMARQLALGASFAAATAADPKMAAELQERLIAEGLKEVTMHEVGHTLGLRHNFKASTWKSLADINDPAKTHDSGSVASVMDYNPTNLAPKGQKQGDFYTHTIGPYDMWAIEYGYKTIAGDTNAEVAELNKIAARSGEAGLTYATDEDTRGIDPDPFSNRFDLGNDALEFAKQRAALVKDLLPNVAERMTKEGDDYTQARLAFNVLLATHGSSMFFAARHVGGLELSRSHKGDAGAKAPVVVLDPKQQREALKLLSENVFNDRPFTVPPEVYNHLGSSRWSHWGAEPTTRPDFPIHDYIAMWQDRILSQLMSSLTLDRMHDAELKVPVDQDCLTTAELIETLTAAVFAEVDNVKDGEYTNRKPAISSLRRNLQRTYLRRLSHLAMGETAAPDDCQTVAYAELSSLNERINKLLESKVKLDSYTRAHLTETSARIDKVLDARLTLARP